MWLPNCFPVLHQNRMLTSNKLLQGSPGRRLRQLLSHPVWLAHSYLPKWAKKNKKMLQPDSHAVNKGWSESACCTFSSFFLSYLLNAVSLTPSVSNPPPLSSSGSVPTVPPGNVQGESVNSTTVRFTWSAPSPQFINGINQGYKVRGPFLSTGAL